MHLLPISPADVLECRPGVNSPGVAGLVGNSAGAFLFESSKVLAFLDIQPLSAGHALVIPKTHGEKLHDVPDDELAELLPLAKKLALAVGATDYNILQNNGRIAHQEVGHVHVHMIPKPNKEEGLTMGWPAKETDFTALGKLHEELKPKM